MNPAIERSDSVDVFQWVARHQQKIGRRADRGRAEPLNLEKRAGNEDVSGVKDLLELLASRYGSVRDLLVVLVGSLARLGEHLEHALHLLVGQPI